MTVIERATRYVATMPPAISGSGGHLATFNVAVALIHGFDLSEDEAWPILLEYNKRCQPPWTEKELRHKLASAGKLQRHPRPRAYLRGSAPAKPAIPAKPLRLRAVDWRQLVARVGKGPEGITAGPAGARAEYGGPLLDRESFIDAAIRIFNATLLPEDGLDSDLRERLRIVDSILSQRNANGGLSFTQSQIKACVIGLSGFAGKHPEVDAMLVRLADAKRSALSWQALAERR